MELASYFADFIQRIRTTPEQLKEMRQEQTLLRERIEADKELRSIVVATFLHGSQRRATAHRPAPGKKSDVDVVLVTNLDKDRVSPREALNKFVPFLERHYSGKYEAQGRSFGITFKQIKLDFVPTSAPSEVELAILKSKAVRAFESPDEIGDWKLSESWLPPEERAKGLTEKLRKKLAEEEEWKPNPLWIPDREVNNWQPTHPLKQIQWTWLKNARCGGYFVNVVKAEKWWRSNMRPVPKYPKGYPLENLIGVCCPDNLTSLAQGITVSLETIVAKYAAAVAKREVPFVPDHGIPKNNVLARVSASDFAAFYEHIVEAAGIARKALDCSTIRESAQFWRELLGDEFPAPPPEPEQKSGGYTPRKDVSVIGGGRFA